jgi:hypothetical protein
VWLDLIVGGPVNKVKSRARGLGLFGSFASDKYRQIQPYRCAEGKGSFVRYLNVFRVEWRYDISTDTSRRTKAVSSLGYSLMSQAPHNSCNTRESGTRKLEKPTKKFSATGLKNFC